MPANTGALESSADKIARPALPHHAGRYRRPSKPIQDSQASGTSRGAAPLPAQSSKQGQDTKPSSSPRSSLSPNGLKVTFATGSADKTMGAWDVRNFSLENHTAAVIGLQWHPQDAAILSSSSYDRRISLWNLIKIEEEQTQEEIKDGPSKLQVALFVLTTIFGWR